MVKAIEPGVRLYEEPPTEGLIVETDWADLWVSAGDWADAFESADPGTPHNEARDQVREALLDNLLDEHENDEEVPPELLRRSLRENPALNSTLNDAWTLIEATDLVGDLWSVPAYLRRCAPWLTPEEVQKLQRKDAQAWTVADLPLLDAARQRLGDPEVSRRQRRREAAVAAERAYMDQVVDDLIQADDDGEGLVTALRRARPAGRPGRRGRTAERRPRPSRRPVRPHRGGRGAGADRRRVANAAAPLPVPELHDRRRSHSGQAWVHGVMAGTA